MKPDNPSSRVTSFTCINRSLNPPRGTLVQHLTPPDAKSLSRPRHLTNISLISYHINNLSHSHHVLVHSHPQVPRPGAHPVGPSLHRHHLATRTHIGAGPRRRARTLRQPVLHRHSRFPDRRRRVVSTKRLPLPWPRHQWKELNRLASQSTVDRAGHIHLPPDEHAILVVFQLMISFLFML